MVRKKNKSLKIILIAFASIVLLAGLFVIVYFALSNSGVRYFNVEITNASGELKFSSNSKSLAPDSTIIDRPVSVNITRDSSNVYLRAKIVFESDSEDNRVLSFVNQLNFAIGSTETYVGENYLWSYYFDDNSFYLTSTDDNLKVITPNDYNYYFFDKLIVPSSLEQISTLNSDGNNVQIGEDITIRVVFEVIQSTDILGNQKPTIENASEYFNNFSVFKENGFTSVNGFITSYTGSETSLILPKYVGEDYILGIKENAFANSNVEKLIILGNYIYFNDNCFNGMSNLNLVTIKSETPIKLGTTSFVSNANLEIYASKNLLSYINLNYSTLSYVNNFVSYTEITNSDVNQIQNKSSKVIYAPNITEFTGNFKAFSLLKVVIAPNLSKINDEAFMNLTNLIDVDTPNVLTIGNNAFNNCSNLLSVSFSKKLESIGEKSFFSCTNLKNINFAKNIEIIPTECFRNCSSLQNVNLLNENLQIGSGAFYNCGKLKTVNVINLTQCNDYAFSYCSSLKYINTKSINIENVSLNSFVNTNSNLFNFVVNKESDKSSFVSKFSNLANNVILININDNILTKFDGNISNLNLADFNFIDKIIGIANDVFKDNLTITSIILPSSVKNIADNFISGCESLTSITFNSSLVPSFTEFSFENAKENLTIYVPESTINVYKETLKNYNFIILAK